MKTNFLTVLWICLLVVLLSNVAIPANGNAGGPERIPVLIGFRQTPGPSEQALVRSHGGVIKFSYSLVPSIAAWIPEPAIEGLLRNPNVTKIEPDIRVYAVDEELDNSWGVKRIGAGMVHGSNMSAGAGVKVAIIDTGIEKDFHPDLVVAGGYNYIPKTTGPPWERVPDPDDWDDDNSHGTHCAGIVAALDNGTGAVGVAPEVSLYALKILGGDNSGFISNVIAALQWATENGIQVTNNSYGTSNYPGEIFEEAFYNSAFPEEGVGIIHVCAAGNSGNSEGIGDNVLYPARFAESCIAVAATDISDNRASFSSTGPAVFISAPGVGIYSTLPGGGYGTKTGTSMASPHVAGVVALMIANGGHSISTLASTADDLGDLDWDPLYGYGLVNAAAAVGIFNNPPTVSITSPEDSSTFSSGDSIPFSGTASDTEDGDLTSSLIWTSDIDGPIGTGYSFSTNLSDGAHEIIASVTDSGGEYGSDLITITVGTPTQLIDVTVGSIGYDTQGGKDNKKHLLIDVSVIDYSNTPVAGALVEIDTYLDNEFYATGTNTTGTNGIASFRLANAPSGTYRTEVISVTGTGLLWDGKYLDFSWPK